ncbi:MAG TPA: YhdP family protein, partial [Methylophilaceae bacterium]|nr:YhdP family protein [Methylophilaceae bacterium]
MVKKSLIWVYRVTLALLWITIVVLACSVLTLRYFVLPNINEYKETIAERTSLIAGQKITIRDIKASWDGLNPHLSLFDVELHDKQGRPALTLGHIETSLSWLSIPLLEPRLSSLTLHQPELTIRREKDGSIYLAGIQMGGPARPAFPNWLLRQSRIDVLDASVLWQDDLRQAPPLTLNKLNLQVVSPAWESLVGHHRFGLRATPSAGSSRPIDLRGNIYGRDVAQIHTWRGTIYGKLEGTDIAAWRNWVSYPFDLREGVGAARFWLDFAKGKPEQVVTDVIFSNVRTRLSRNNPEVVLKNLSGRLKWTEYADGQEMRAERIKMVSADGLNMQNGNIGIRERSSGGKQSVEGDVRLDELQLETLNSFIAYLPLSADTLQRFNDLAPSGKLQKLELRWKGKPQPENSKKFSMPAEYTLRSRFSGLGMQAYEKIPGFSNLSGSIDTNESIGILTLNSQQATLNFKQELRWPIPVDKLSGMVKWNRSGNKTEFRTSGIAIANQHLAGNISGSYLHNGIKGGYLNLDARFAHADIRFAPYYYPYMLGEKTMDWLDNAILAGRGEDVNVLIKGNLQEFPFPNNKQGLFKVSAKIHGGVLQYSTDWPKLENLKLDMLFEGTRMELNASGGSSLGNQILKTKVTIPALNSPHPLLTVNGEALGPVSEGIKFLNSSPLVDITGDFTRSLRTSGSGKLNLELLLPLHELHSPKVKGSYTVANGSMASEGVPELTRINGKLEFTESSLRAQNVNTWLYGGPAQFYLATGKDGVIRINARGRVTDAGLKQAFGPGLADRIMGTTDWVGDINIQQQMVEMAIRSTLAGMASTLPPPLAKTEAERMLLRIEKKQSSPQQDMISINLSNLVAVKLLRTEQNGTLQPDRGEIGLNVQPEIPNQRGLAIRGVLEQLDLDEWRNLLDKSAAAGGQGTSLPISKVDMAVNVLDIFDRRINGLKLNARPISNGWQIGLQSREITGDAQWLNNGGGSGKVVAHLKNLITPGAAPGVAQLRTQGQFQQQAEEYPALDVVAENFEVSQKKLGRLELIASEQNEDWSIEKLRISNPDSVLTAEGEWHNWKRNPNTRINFSWDITNV